MPNGKQDLSLLIYEMAVSDSEKAYNEVFRRLFRPVMRFSYNIVKSTESAEEIASDVLLMIWQNRMRLQYVSNIKYYAFVAAKNMSLNLLKKNLGKDTVSLEDVNWDIQFVHSEAAAIFMQSDLREKYERAIESLPPQGKIVFKLIKEEGFSYKEVAEMLGVSVKTVDAHLVTGVKRVINVIKSAYKLT